MERVRCRGCGAGNDILTLGEGRCRLCARSLADAEHLGQASTARRQLNKAIPAVAGAVIALGIVAGFLYAFLASPESPEPTTTGPGVTAQETTVPTGTDASDADPIVEGSTARSIGAWALALVAALLTAIGIRLLHRRHLLIDVPTSGAAGVFIGLNQVDGVVRCAEPLTSVRDTPVVMIRYRNTRTTIHHDAQGNEQRRSEVSTGRHVVPFEVEDESGRILVDPRGATLHTHVYEERTFPAPEGEQERHEELVPVDAPVTVLGPVELDADEITPRIVGRADEPLLVTVGGEREQLRSDLGWQIMAQTTAAAMAAGVPLLAPGLGNPPLPAVLVGPVLIGLVTLGAYLMFLYNSLVRLRQSVTRSLSLIDVQLRRRADLLPRVVEVVRGYATHERDTLTAVTAARMPRPPDPDERADDDHVARTADALEAQEQVTTTLAAVLEEYPELQAVEQFLALQEEVAGTEDRIAMARRFYHDARLQYRQRAETFPGTLVAWLTGSALPEPWAQTQGVTVRVGPGRSPEVP